MTDRKVCRRSRLIKCEENIEETMTMRQRNLLKMNQDLFADLPLEIITDILSRLPARTIISCKCVRKSWLNLIKTREFVKAHLSKAVPDLLVYWPRPALREILQFEDGLGIEHHELHYNPITKFNLPYNGWINGSANGLLFVSKWSTNPHSLYICNPLTRDYIELHCPQEFAYSCREEITYGFGASKISFQHKVVRISQDCQCECHVYTIGTGSWKRVAPVSSLLYDRHSSGTYLNGNLHWFAFDLTYSQLWISCFDLEIELFTTFFCPAPPLMINTKFDKGLFVLGDCLSICDNNSHDEIVIWLMKEYGVEKSWTKEFVIAKNSPVFETFAVEFVTGVVYPIKVFEDGDIVMALEPYFLFYYCKKDNTTKKIDMFEQKSGINAFLHTQSVISLKSFRMENAISF